MSLWLISFIELMKNLLNVFLLLLIIFSCEKEKEISSINPVNWEKRLANYQETDSLIEGSSYLSVYSVIYSQTEHITHDLTATISLRNANRNDTVFIEKAEYFDTHGNSIRSYFNKPIYIAPMETVEIVIDETDREGGTGGNFLFDWKIKATSIEPLFEAIMISTSGQQGLSFSTEGKRIK